MRRDDAMVYCSIEKQCPAKLTRERELAGGESRVTFPSGSGSSVA